MTELETMQRAKMYIDKLAQGIDPITKQEIRLDSCLNDARLVRCFFYLSGVLQKLIDNGGTVDLPQKKREFTISPQQLARVAPMPYPIRITEFTMMLHDAVGDPQMRQLNPTRITMWLQIKGFLENQVASDGKNTKVPTQAGHKIGISTRLSQSRFGEYRGIYYDACAQQFLLDHLPEILWQKK